MIAKIRKGNDFKHIWPITWNGQPEDFSDATDITLTAKVYGQVKTLTEGVDYHIDGGTVTIDFTPAICDTTGTYTVELNYIKPSSEFIDGDRRSAVDVQAFRIVNTSAEANVTEGVSLPPSPVPDYVLKYGDLTEAQKDELRGAGITSIEQTASSGSEKTYTITYGDSHTTTFTVKDGNDGHTPVISFVGTTIYVDGVEQVDLKGDKGEQGEGFENTNEEGFFITDDAGNIALQVNRDGFDVAKVSDHFKSLLPSGSASDSSEYDHLEFSTLYMVDNKYKENQFIPAIQSERFVNDVISNDVKANRMFPLVDGAHWCVPRLGELSSTDALMTSGSTKSVEMTVELSRENSSKKYVIPYSLKKTYSDAVTSQIRLLCISDSFGASQGGSDLYPEYSFFSYAQKLGMTDAALRGLSDKYITLGTGGMRYNGWGTWNVGEQELTLISHAEGRGYWTASTYARHILNTLNNRGMWYILGLDNTYGDYDTYSGGTPAVELIHSTPSTVIDSSFIKNEDAYIVAYNGTTPPTVWDGSTSVKEAAAAYYNSMINNTIDVNPLLGGHNPFFNKDKVGDIKFDLQYYLDNWKTHADDGVTPLVIGETAGNKVTYINNNIKVCTPTHVCILMGTNDTTKFDNPQKVYDDMIAIAKACVEVSDVKVCLVYPITSGSAYPERHNGVTVQPPWWPHVEQKWNHFKAMQELFANDSTIDKSKIFWLDTFICTDVASTSPGSVPAMIPSMKSDAHIIKKDPVHLGIASHRDIGYQIYAWTYYTSFNL